MVCLGVHAIESLDVRVPTNSVKMMKRNKVARSKSSNFDSFSRSSEKRNSVVLVLVEDLREFS